MAEKIGFFGGSFDPIHYGHLILAEQCREQAELDRVIFVPASMSPHKLAGPHATDRQRIEMLRLALSGHTPFEPNDIEIKRDGVSYSVETLEYFAQLFPDAQLFLLLGSDSLQAFMTWKQPEKICKLTTPLVYERHDSNASIDILSELVSQDRLEEIKQQEIIAPRIEISSSDLRSRIASGRSIRYLTPRPVEKYIETNQIYMAENSVVKNV